MTRQEIVATKQSLTSRIIDFESGLLEDEEVIQLFQDLIDTGLAWTLQGSYGRTASQLIQQGICVLPNL